MSRRAKNITVVVIVFVILGAMIATGVAKDYLEEPIFEKVYVEKDFLSYETSNLTLSIITNRYDKRRVESITFYDREGNTYEATTMHEPQQMKIGFHTQHLESMTIKLKSGKFIEDAVLKEGEVLFDNGDKQTVDFGEIYLYKGSGPAKYLVNTSQGSSINGEMQSGNYAQYEFELISIESPLLEQLGDEYTLLLNGERFEEADKRFHVGRQFDIEIVRNSPHEAFKVGIFLKLTIRDSDGKESEFYMHEMTSLHPMRSRNEMRNYLDSLNEK